MSEGRANLVHVQHEHNEWGLALALQSSIGGDLGSFLLDCGCTPSALLNNMQMMGIDPGRIQGPVPSHGQFGGLIGFRQKYRESLPADLTLYVGGEDVLRDGQAAGVNQLLHRPHRVHLPPRPHRRHVAFIPPGTTAERMAAMTRDLVLSR